MSNAKVQDNIELAEVTVHETEETKPLQEKTLVTVRQQSTEFEILSALEKQNSDMAKIAVVFFLITTLFSFVLIAILISKEIRKSG